jgi:hypothetical protein
VQVAVIGVRVVIMRRVISTVGVVMGVPEVRRFDGEMAVAVDVQDQPVRRADAAAREDGKRNKEGDAGVG